MKAFDNKDMGPKCDCYVCSTYFSGDYPKDSDSCPDYDNSCLEYDNSCPDFYYNCEHYYNCNNQDYRSWPLYDGRTFAEWEADETEYEINGKKLPEFEKEYEINGKKLPEFEKEYEINGKKLPEFEKEYEINGKKLPELEKESLLPQTDGKCLSDRKKYEPVLKCPCGKTVHEYNPSDFADYCHFWDTFEWGIQSGQKWIKDFRVFFLNNPKERKALQANLKSKLKANARKEKLFFSVWNVGFCHGALLEFKKGHPWN